MHDTDLLERSWFAIFTATNNEKKIEQKLNLRGFETFLPLYGSTRRWKNRTTVELELPLFSGYVFARFARTESVKILDVPMVYSIVGNRQGALALPDAEIEALRAGLVPADVVPHVRLEVGQRARIRSGPLANWEGIVSRVDDSLRVVLTVESIMRSIAVRVGSDDLELLSDEAGKQPQPQLVGFRPSVNS
jgi:transcription antitermination factor NusG